MLRQIFKPFSSTIKKSPRLKHKLLQAWDLYHKYFPFVIGAILRFPAYLINIRKSYVIAKPGTLGFEGGMFNPGVFINENKQLVLLAKAQVLPWFKAVGKNRKFYLEGSPVALQLNSKTLKRTEAMVINKMARFPAHLEWAVEDFRVFEWENNIMVNHSFITKKKNNGYFYLDSVTSAVSIFDQKNMSLTFHAFPKLDIPLQKFEKNWIYTAKGDDLFLFYSVSPYRILKLEDTKNFSFRTAIIIDPPPTLKDPGGFGSLVSYSTNPIDFDDQHYLVIIHQIKHRFTGRCYYHWAVLIDKPSMLPVKITSKPIFSGMGARGRTPGIRYISSIIIKGEDILFFGGEGDVYITVTKKKIQDLQSLFIAV